MALNYHYPVVNPRLGASFGIFASAYVSLVLTLLILEQLGLAAFWVNQLMILGPALFYLVIGMMVRTTNLEDFFVAGERVPALYNGLSVSANVLGASAVATALGALVFLGYDGLPLVLGWCAGLALLAILFAPYLRKAGSFTMPGFLGMRFSSGAVRAVAAVLIIIPSAMLLAAELKIGAMVAALFLPLPEQMLIAIGAGFATLTVLLGGMRSLTWVQSAQIIVLLLGISAPLVIVSLQMTNLPVPQLSYGAVLENMAAAEQAKDIQAASPQPLSQALPGTAPAEIEKPFLQAFGAMTAVDFVMLGLCVMLGTAMLPVVHARLSTTPTIGAVRGSMGWAGLIAGFVVLSLLAYGAFLHSAIVQQVIGTPLAEMPAWARYASDLGLMRLGTDALDPTFGDANALLSRDLSALVLPIAGGLPQVFAGVAAAALLAAMLAGAAAQITVIGNVLSNDLFHPVLRRPSTAAQRLAVARGGMILAAIAGAWLARDLSVDPLRWMLLAFSLLAGGFFAVLVLAIWWRRVTASGAMAGLLAGFGTTGAYMMVGGEVAGNMLFLDPLTAGLVGVPAAFIAASVVSLISPKPGELTAEIANEIRVSGGETLHARLTRLSARGKAPRP
ncbi:MAG: sodium:solute symporter family transporter [Dichotomicrobium sp.]